MRRFWSKKPDLSSQLRSTLQSYGYNVQHGEAGEWWIWWDGQVWARLSNASNNWTLEIIEEEKDILEVDTLLLLTSVLRETQGFPISSSATSRTWERPITEKRLVEVGLRPAS